jgi:hypothetical protein
MPTRPVAKKDPAKVLQDFPIAGRVDGWFFRQRETSNGAYLVEGTDLWGRAVSRQGDDPDELLSQCVADAQRISTEAKDAV